MAVVHAPGRLGQYELGERLGAGGMAEVFVAQRAGPHGFAKKFAVKRILPQLSRDARFVAMFCDEARICAALNHPNIVQVVDFGESDGELFMAMEFVDGVSTAKLLRFVAARRERFPLTVALFITHEVLRALSYAHESCDEEGRSLGIVHRDVSPGNVLVGRAGDVKLADFGIVRGSFIDRRTYPGELKGKMGYMSPEQVVGLDVDARSDLFTLGIILGEMLLGRPLFPGRNELEILTRIHEADLRVLERHGADLSPPVVELLKEALARDKDARFASARDFAGALRRVARANDVALSDAELVPWLSGLGILSSSSGAQEVFLPRRPPDRSFTPQERPLVVRTPEERKALREALERARSVPPPPQTDRKATSTLPPPHTRESYFVKLPTGSELGPLSVAELAELSATGKVSTNARVRSEHGGECTLAKVRGFSRFAERPAYDFSGASAAQAAWQRRFDKRVLPSVLYGLVNRHRNGLLLLSGARQRRIFFRDGNPAFIASSDPRELLGALLVEKGVVEPDVVEQAIAVALERHTRMGELLVTHGALRPTALLRALIEQLERRFIEAARQGDGSMAFFPRLTSGEEEVSVPSLGLGLVTRMVRECYSEAELSAWLSPVWKSRVQSAAASRKVDLATLGLSATERHLLDELASGGSVEQVVARALGENQLTRRDALTCLFIGLSAELLEIPGASFS